MTSPDPDLVAALEAGAMVVTANKRLARALGNEYALAMLDRGEMAWPTPRILSWDVWVKKCWMDGRGNRQAGHVLLSDRQAETVWKQIIRTAGGVDGGARLSARARRSWQLMLEWCIPVTELEDYPGPDAKYLARWIRSYKTYLNDHRFIDQHCLEDAVEFGPDDGPLLLAGFYELNPRQQSLLDRLRKAGGEVQMLSRSVESRIRELRACADPEQELVAAANWAAKRLNAQAESSIGIIVPDLVQQQDAAERIFTRILQPGENLPGAQPGQTTFHLSVGRPLLEQTLIKDALLALQLVTTGLNSSELSRFLRSPYFRTGASQWQRAMLDVACRSRWFAAASPGNVAWQCGADKQLQNLCQQMNALQKERPGGKKANSSDWVVRFSKWLGTMGWPGDRVLDSGEFQATQQWGKLLSELGRLGLVTGPLGAKDALDSLIGLAMDTVFQPKAKFAAVQIMGTLEAAGARFDALWICGLDDKSFPAAIEPAPLLPVGLQKKYGLPNATARRSIEFAGRLIGELVHGAPEVVMSWAKIVDDEPRRASPLLPGLHGEHEEWPVAAEPANRPGNPIGSKLLNSATESVDDYVGPEASGRGRQKGGTSIFTHQSQCPFRSFAVIRLGAESLESPEPGISARLKGDLAHKTLEYLWRHLKDRKELLAQGPGELETLISEGFDNAWDAKKSETMLLGKSIRQLEKRRQASLIRRLLEYEKSRIADFLVVQTEELIDAEVGGLTIGMKIDRVDELRGDGRRLIIDYKTGKDKAADSLGTRPAKPQLAVYATGSKEHIAGVCIARLNAEHCTYDGILADPVLGPNDKAYTGRRVSDEKTANWDELLEAWRQRLGELGKAFRAGDARTDPLRGACDYCQLTAACRILESGESGDVS